MKFRKGDYVIAAGILLFALTLCAFLYFPKTQGNTVLVYENGVLVQKLALQGAQQTYEMSHALISYGGEGAWFESSDCPDQVCVHTGRLTKPGQSAVCIPNRIMIEIEGDAPVDAVIR